MDFKTESQLRAELAKVWGMLYAERAKRAADNAQYSADEIEWNEQLTAEREKVAQLENTAKKLAAGTVRQAIELAAAQATIANMRDRFISIWEYWNRDRNEAAMADACEYAIETAEEAIALPTNLDALHEDRAQSVESGPRKYALR